MPKISRRNFLSLSLSLSLVLAILLGLPIVSKASPLFHPGQTLNPGCLPSNPDCAVTSTVSNSLATSTVASNLTVQGDGGFSGKVTAASFYGDGSNLTGIGTSSGTVLFNTPIYSTTVTYQHPRDPGELTGNARYSYTILGMYEQMSSSTLVSAILANVWCTNTSRDISFKVFSSPSLTAFNPDTATPLYSGTINHNVMPHTSTSAGFLFSLSKSVTVPSGQYIYVVWESVTSGELNIAYYNMNSADAPYRHSFFYGSLNSNFILTDTPSGYYGATFRVYGYTDITRSIATTPSLGSELLSNPGWESPGIGFNDGGLGGTADEQVVVHSGSHAIKLTSTASSWYVSQQTQTMTVTPGTTYQLSFWTRGDGVNAGKYSLYDVTHSSYLNSSGSGLSTGVSGTSYSQVITTFTAPAGCTSVRLYLVTSNVSGSVVYFDDASVKAMSYSVTLNPVSIQTILNNFPANAVTFSDPNSIMTSNNVRDAIVEAYNHGTSSQASSSGMVAPRIILPDNIYAVVGDELQLFTRGMIEAQNPYNLPYVISSSVGASYPRYFDYTPSLADIGSHPLTVKVMNYDYSVLTSTTTNIVVVNASSSPTTTKKILVVGDSLSGGGTWQAELYRRLTQTGGTPAGNGFSNINFIGDIAMPGYPTQGYDAWGGWSYSTYTDTANTAGHTLSGTFDKDATDSGSLYTDGTNQWSIIYAKSGNILKIGTYGGAGSATLASSGTLTWVSGGTHHANIVYTAATNEPISPFWDSANSKFDFTAFTNRVGASGIDAVYVLLSWNSIFNPNLSTFSYLTQTQTFLNQIHTDYPNAIVRLVGVQVPSINGGLGANYGGTGTAEYYGLLRTVNNNNIALQNLADQPSYSSWVKFISLAPQFDSENNMPQSLFPVNTRNTATEYRGTNGVHPATQGYYQIADAVYRQFVGDFCSK